LKAAWEKHRVTHKGKSIRITDIAKETLKASKAWNDILQVLKENSCWPSLLYPEDLSSKIKGEIMTIYDKCKLKESMTTKPELMRLLKIYLHTEEEDKHNHDNKGKNKFH
jgi:hypothetical protein